MFFLWHYAKHFHGMKFRPFVLGMGQSTIPEQYNPISSNDMPQLDIAYAGYCKSKADSSSSVALNALAAGTASIALLAATRIRDAAVIFKPHTCVQ